MINRELLAFIRAQKDAGVERPAIEAMLSTSGWSREDVASAFKMIDVLPPTPTSTDAQPKTPSAPIIAAAPQNASDYLPPKIRKPKKWIFPLFMVIAFFALAAGTAYAYVERLGPFSHPPYTERDLISGLLETSSSITSATYKANASLETVPRDADATPYVAPAPDSSERLKYLNDVERVQKISSALSELKWSASGYGPAPKSASNAPYTVTKTENGSNFELRTTFESDAAVLALKKNMALFSNGGSATSTKFAGRTVTFTKDSPNFLYIPQEPAKPWLQTLNESAASLPADISGSIELGATARFGKNSAQSDGELDFTAKGDLGDLSYTLSLEARKVDNKYYLRLNKFPSILLGAESAFKGVWISFSTTTLATSNTLSYISRSIPDLQKSYQERSAKIRSTLASIAKVADDTHILEFTNPPIAEKVDGVNTYRYELSIRKDSIVDFYKALKKELDPDALLLVQNTIFDPALATTVDEPSFDATFDYVKKNTFIRLWVDALGKPVKFEYQIRVVPPDTAKNYAGKQLFITFDVNVSKINAPVQVTAPEDAKPLEDILKEQISQADIRGMDASVKSNLSAMRAQSELYYSNHSSYGGTTDSCVGGIFADQGMQQMITAVKKSAGEAVSCHGKPSGWAASAKLSVGTFYCVDSSGNAREQGAALKNGETKCVALVVE